MSGYDKDLSKEYSDNREKYTETNSAFVETLHDIGLKDKKLLDFGCGDGVFAFKFAQEGAESMTGIDASEEMISLAQEKLAQNNLSNVSFQVADGNSLPFKNSSFDIVFANFVLVVMPDLKKPLEEIYRVLKPGGYFIATVNNAEIDDLSLRSKPIPLILGDSVQVEDYLRTDEETKNTLESVGFKITSYTNVPNQEAVFDPSFPEKEKIKDFHCVLFVVRKPQ